MDSSNGSLVVVGSKNERLVPGLRYMPSAWAAISVLLRLKQPHATRAHTIRQPPIRYRLDHTDVVYFGSCAVVFMLPLPHTSPASPSSWQSTALA